MDLALAKHIPAAIVAVELQVQTPYYRTFASARPCQEQGLPCVACSAEEEWLPRARVPAPRAACLPADAACVGNHPESII